MSLLKKLLKFSVLGFLVAVACFVAVPRTLALPGDTELTGWAWSSNIGWISLNCSNTDDGARCLSSDPGTEPVSNYKVKYDSAAPPAGGDFTGYAWSSSIGWINFDPGASGRPSGSGTTASDAKFVADTTNCTAKEIRGWARAVPPVGGFASGWDGWISMSGSTTGGAHYGVCLNSTGVGLGGTATCATTPDPMNCGYAWGSDVVGWIQFNSTFSRNRPIIIEVRPR